MDIHVWIPVVVNFKLKLKADQINFIKLKKIAVNVCHIFVVDFVVIHAKKLHIIFKIKIQLMQEKSIKLEENPVLKIAFVGRLNSKLDSMLMPPQKKELLLLLVPKLLTT